MTKLTKILFVIAGLIAVNANAAPVNWQEKIVKINNKYKMHYYYAGHGTPLILLNGYGVTSNFWSASFVNCLAQNHTVYLIDYRGIGTNEKLDKSQNAEDMARDIYELVRASDIKKPDIIGWSMGGMVAQQLSYSYPDTFGRIALIAPVLMDNSAQLDTDQDKPEFKNMNQVLDYVFDNNLYEYVPSKRAKYKSDLFKPNGKLFPDGDIITNQLMAIEYWRNSEDTEDKVLGSNAQYLLLVANNDKVLSKDKTLSDATELKNVKVLEFDGSGHDIVLQAPDLACKQIESFINIKG